MQKNTTNNAARDAGQHKPYFIKYEGSERQHMTGAEAAATIRALAFVGDDTAAIGNIVDGICGRLSDEAYRMNLRSQVRREGLDPLAQTIACREKCYAVQVLADNAGPWKTEIIENGSSPYVALNDQVAICPELNKGLGRLLYFKYAVQSIYEDDNDPSYVNIIDAIADAALRIENARVREAFRKTEHY